MTRKLNRLVARALKAASATEGQLAKEAGYHPVSFARFKTGARRPTVEAALALAGVLRARSRKLAELADALEQAAGKEEA